MTLPGRQTPKSGLSLPDSGFSPHATTCCCTRTPARQPTVVPTEAREVTRSESESDNMYRRSFTPLSRVLSNRRCSTSTDWAARCIRFVQQTRTLDQGSGHGKPPAATITAGMAPTPGRKHQRLCPSEIPGPSAPSDPALTVGVRATTPSRGGFLPRQPVKVGPTSCVPCNAGGGRVRPRHDVASEAAPDEQCGEVRSGCGRRTSA